MKYPKKAKWKGGLVTWQEGATTYLSVAFTWKIPEAFGIALTETNFGQRVIAGGPAFVQKEMRDLMLEIKGVEVPTITAFRRGKMRAVPAPLAEGPVIQRHNPLATLASRGCSEDCSFCTVPILDGKFTYLPEFPVRPILLDNNLSALPVDYQNYIIERYTGEGVKLIDAQSGFEPWTFDEEVYRRWKPLINGGGGPWRFGYDTTDEGERVRKVMRMLKDEKPRRKRVYVLIGNEPFADCMARIQDVLDHGCEPHCQPFLSLNALDREPHDRHDWTGQKMKQVARWANRRLWRKTPDFADYDPLYDSHHKDETYDAHQGLFI